MRDILATLAAVAAVLLGGCGSNASEDTTTLVPECTVTHRKASITCPAIPQTCCEACQEALDDGKKLQQGDCDVTSLETLLTCMREISPWFTMEDISVNETDVAV